MTYRRTKKYSEAREREAQESRHRARMDRPVPKAPLPLPDLRMRIVIERFDGADAERHEFSLLRSPRVDVYRVLVDGIPWAVCGLSRVLEGLRKATPRRLSDRAVV